MNLMDMALGQLALGPLAAHNLEHDRAQAPQHESRHWLQKGRRSERIIKHFTDGFTSRDVAALLDITGPEAVNLLHRLRRRGAIEKIGTAPTACKGNDYVVFKVNEAWKEKYK